MITVNDFINLHRYADDLHIEVWDNTTDEYLFSGRFDQLKNLDIKNMQVVSFDFTYENYYCVIYAK